MYISFQFKFVASQVAFQFCDVVFRKSRKVKCSIISYLQTYQRLASDKFPLDYDYRLQNLQNSLFSAFPHNFGMS